METVFLNGMPLALDAPQLLQSGGEGMVFGVGETAVKVYHRPGKQHRVKLRHLLHSGLAARLPENVLAPCAPVTDGDGAIVGLQMPRLPAGSQPLKQLANPRFCRTHALDARHVIPLFRHVHDTLSHLHRQGIVVGDLNEHNVFFKDGHSYWIDVDSYQIGDYPCPVAMQPFLDPALYDVTDFGRAPVFTPLTDWYAYFVLLVKALLHVHPHGGVHPRYKTLAARARAGVTILDDAVTYPRNARPVAVLGDEMQHHLHRVFAEGYRSPFPRLFLDRYEAALIRCENCGLAYPGSRPGCPACHHPALRTAPRPGGQTPFHLRQLVATQGLIVHVAVRPSGRIAVVVREGDGAAATVRLIRAGTGGQYDALPLFQGQGDYRFGFFDGHLVVARSRQLLILDVDGDAARPVARVETAAFGRDAVFATTPRHLYRIANGVVLRGSVRGGSFVEDVVATAHRNQTQLWAAPGREALAGCHRIFAEHRFFVIDDGASYDVVLPAGVLGAGDSLKKMAAYFSDAATAFLLAVARDGRLYTHAVVVSGRGEVLRHTRVPAETPPGRVGGKALVATTLLHPVDGGILKTTATGDTLLSDPAGTLSAADILHPHPAGVLVQQPSHLYLAVPN